MTTASFETESEKVRKKEKKFYRKIFHKGIRQEVSANSGKKILRFEIFPLTFFISSAWTWVCFDGKDLLHYLMVLVWVDVGKSFSIHWIEICSWMSEVFPTLKLVLIFCTLRLQFNLLTRNFNLISVWCKKFFVWSP